MRPAGRSRASRGTLVPNARILQRVDHLRPVRAEDLDDRLVVLELEEGLLSRRRLGEHGDPNLSIYEIGGSG